ncbi:hypothetical protein BZL29_1808 [Mycobacterium kansasii]|uniref:Uncharacterized protein n=1 Tax=Mycobacterium kansasii TaxID=1768 RepID=A0A1V3XNQ5_MYCKA|nr:hypothetical protein BZL29_1808 [Mycobacterium kansasii]
MRIRPPNRVEAEWGKILHRGRQRLGSFGDNRTAGSAQWGLLIRCDLIRCDRVVSAGGTRQAGKTGKDHMHAF